jgi:hypothetical protein
MRKPFKLLFLIGLACGAQTPVPESPTCEADAVLREIARTLTRDRAPSQDLFLRSSDVNTLNGADSQTPGPTQQFDYAIVSSAIRDIEQWRRKLHSYSLESIRLGRIHRGPVEGLAPNVESMQGSLLIFESRDEVVAVPIETLYRVNGCWKVVEIGSPGEVSAESEAPVPRDSSMTSRECLPSEQLMSRIADALIAPVSVADEITPSSEELTSAGVAAEEALRLVESIRFDAHGDFDRWKKVITRGAIISSETLRERDEHNWLDLGLRVVLLEGVVVVELENEELRRVPVREMARFGDCVKLIWLGAPNG